MLIVNSVGDYAWKVANVLRDSDPSKCNLELLADIHLLQYTCLATASGKLVIENVIPAISRLRQSLPLRFDTMFSPDVLQSLELKSDALNCTDLRQSDRVFDSLLLKYVYFCTFLWKMLMSMWSVNSRM